MKLSKTNLKLLNFINENPGLTQSEIGAKLNLSKGTISTFIKIAKNSNYVFEIKKETKIKLHPTRSGKNLFLENSLKNLIENKKAK
ncbi:winged helix-turn-helix transcriptional regulator [Cetobacterium somerae]|uniref:winged helix-turn-helix transcriptional regulator n=1 Tax=Cetobacterium somerae TaxID=188913 RepID=UPI002E7BE6B2|nr:winged helix-turn-helix transcriptional regulator [Cetobacterium somerae]WVJ00657.1 winged helix-turn-helix transcriptional regulator [Cetobacterium somerae]